MLTGSSNVDWVQNSTDSSSQVLLEIAVTEIYVHLMPSGVAPVCSLKISSSSDRTSIKSTTSSRLPIHPVDSVLGDEEVGIQNFRMMQWGLYPSNFVHPLTRCLFFRARGRRFGALDDLGISNLSSTSKFRLNKQSFKYRLLLRDFLLVLVDSTRG